MQNKEPRLCPFLNKPCIKEECQIWSGLKNNCAIVATSQLLNDQIMNAAAKDRTSMYPQK